MKAIGSTDKSAIVMDGFVPVIDLSIANDAEGRAAVAKAIGQACEDSGFFTIVGHGIELDLIDRVYAVSRKFFELPLEEKAKVAVRPGTQGLYLQGGSVAKSIGKDAPPDLTEIFRTVVQGDLPEAELAKRGSPYDPWAQKNLWPEGMPEFREVFQEYTGAIERLGQNLMQLFAIALGLDEHYFDDKINNDMSSVVANYYPPIVGTPLPGQKRKGAHTDWGVLTILYQDNMGGLQVEQEGHGWRDVPYVEGSYVINIGDLMAFWTGGHWVSTMHRVANPDRNRDKGRISIPFFLFPTHDLPIEPFPQFSEGGKSERFKGSTTPAKWLEERFKATLS